MGAAAAPDLATARIQRVDAPNAMLALVRLPCAALVEPLHALAAEPQVTTHMEWAPHRSIADTEAFFAHCATDLESGRGLHLAVVDPTSGSPMGVASFLFDPARPDRAEITRWLGSSFWGRGIGTRLLSVLCEVGFAHLGLSKLTLRVAGENLAAQRSIAALGIPREAVSRDELEIRGRRVDALHFGLAHSAYRSNHYAAGLRVRHDPG